MGKFDYMITCQKLSEYFIFSSEEIVYIDDIPEYTSMFRNLGGNTIDYNCTKIPIKKLKEQLKLFNLLV